MRLNQIGNKLNLQEAKPDEQHKQQRDPIEQLNPISLLKKPDQFKQAFFSMTTLSTDCFKAKNYERCATALTKCVDMLDLGKNILKDINKYWKTVVFGNLACCYHYTRKLSKCNKFCEKVKQEIQKIITDFPDKQCYLKLSRILIKLKFQHCAILSQLQQHQKAFELCKSTLPMLKQMIDMLVGYVQQNSASDLMQKKSSETVQFSKQVYKFSENILNDLLKCMNEPLKGKERGMFYYWEKNPEQNEEQVKKKFIPHGENNNCKRSILGVSKSSHWIDEFNIGSIMHFSEMNISDFDASIPMEEYLFKDKLYQIVIYCSMAHFTMATELRLIESSQQEKNEAANQNSNLGQAGLMKKYGYEQKSELFKLSEVYHLRSIDIMARNIKTTVPYITHIIRSYQKHYIKQKKVLEPIAAIVEESALSINESHDEKVQKQQIYSDNQVLSHNNRILQDRNDYGSFEPYNELLIESQKFNDKLQYQRSHFQEDKLNKNSKIEPKMSPTEDKKDPELKKLSTLHSEHIPHESENAQDDLNNSGEYLKSHRDNKGYKKKSQIKDREKSKPKLMTVKSVGKDLPKIQEQKPRDSKRQKVKEGHKIRVQNEQKGQKRMRDKRQIRKDKNEDFDHQKYGEKEIKIKTQSCTHIKVFYKKKK